MSDRVPNEIWVDQLFNFLQLHEQSQKIIAFNEIVQGLHSRLIVEETNNFSKKLCDVWQMQPPKAKWTSSHGHRDMALQQQSGSIFASISSESSENEDASSWSSSQDFSDQFQSSTEVEPTSSPWNPLPKSKNSNFGLTTSTMATSLEAASGIMPWRKTRFTHRPRTIVGCIFCHHNKEPEHVWKNHILKDPHGIVRCPRLRKYNCPECQNQGGDFAHTLTYCPQYRARMQLQKTIPDLIQLL